MTIGSDMVFELKCLRCRTVYRSEVAHVGKTLKCACGCLVKIVPPLKSLTDTAGTPTRRTPATLSIKELTFWFAVAGALVVAGIFISRLTSEKVRSADQNNSSLSVKTNQHKECQRERFLVSPAHNLSYPGDRYTSRSGHRYEWPWKTCYREWDGRRCCRQAIQLGRRSYSFLFHSGSQYRTCRSNSRRAIPLAFTTGLDYVESADSFRWQPEYFDFEKTIVFDEQRRLDGVRYKTVSVSLHPVIDGNIQRRSITRDQFLNRHHHALPTP